MSDLEISILPNGQIMVEQSADPAINKALIDLLTPVVNEQQELEEFLKSAENSEQIIGDEPMCG
jgi:hypothetical protein